MPRTLFPAASPETRARLEQDPALKLFNDYDWASNPLGPIPEWPESLKGAVRLMMPASIPMAIFVGPQAILLYNNAYAAFAGQRHPGIFGLPCRQAWPEIADLMDTILAIGQRGGVEVLHDLEMELNRHGQPESTWVDMHVSPVLGDDGNALGTLVTIHETTERFLARAALARSEERLSLALAGSSLVGTWDWNLHDNVITADDQFAEMFGIEPLYAGLGVPLRRYFAAIHPDDLPGVKAEIERAIAAVDEFRCECRVRNRDGSLRWIVASGLPRRDGEGRVHRFPGVAIDVTEQHRVASALADSQLRFQTLANVMPQIVWTATPDGVYDYYNARWEELTGVADAAPDAAQLASLYHPEDRERVEAAWQHSLRTGETFEIEYRLRHRSGEYRWVLGRALAVR
ncbi:PAS domain-containing protein, partial [Devosia sp.]|uniref:PAS domain-containing protein n=1 Tax=Devosia sp. TaxID=1871048 RepID=UPI002AFF9ED0